VNEGVRDVWDMGMWDVHMRLAFLAAHSAGIVWVEVVLVGLSSCWAAHFHFNELDFAMFINPWFISIITSEVCAHVMRVW